MNLIEDAMKPTTFSELLETIQLDANGVSLELTPDWLQGRTAYGGWQAALAVVAMRQLLGPGIPLRSLQSNFVGPVGVGKITARAELLRRGKSAAQLEARIVVDGQTAFTAVGIFGAPRVSQLALAPKAPASNKAFATLEPRPYVDGVMPVFLQHFDTRWAKGGYPFSGAAHSAAQIYARLREEEISTEAHLVMIGDVIPPSAIALFKSPIMLSSMNWTLELVTPLDAETRAGWLRFDSELTAAGDGYGWENTSIWSSKGELVALSRQCVALFG
jgi:acyl-CoA thioesterase